MINLRQALLGFAAFASATFVVLSEMRLVLSSEIVPFIRPNWTAVGRNGFQSGKEACDATATAVKHPLVGIEAIRTNERIYAAKCLFDGLSPRYVKVDCNPHTYVYIGDEYTGTCIDAAWLRDKKVIVTRGAGNIDATQGVDVIFVSDKGGTNILNFSQLKDFIVIYADSYELVPNTSSTESGTNSRGIDIFFNGRRQAMLRDIITTTPLNIINTK
ncbi:hypothetical protein G7B40_039860 [Aetokthonos hydrillicola Thurmond2011]|jgi:hypothetical protein|uniref:Uncharacterized protein n=1 Tax=Aetokthonos hydrillicola Thurmond2011 TaxID=2712845 RepID=A0AAP5MDJ2_9CYAN|nr:hypothetical protein [Aetokthonos hydrillicola]MBW4590122.1 hypothetical protein [Aetokthonos hydrillicola CCALA 1050]MDR9900647.1 hypothetical protein [Aetokthonos hydrillicola Thurmond2011]